MQEHIIGIGFQRHLCVGRDTKRLTESVDDFDQRGCRQLCRCASTKEDGSQQVCAGSPGDDFMANGIDVALLSAILVARIGIEIAVAAFLRTKRYVNVGCGGLFAFRLPVPSQQLGIHVAKCVRGVQLF